MELLFVVLGAAALGAVPRYAIPGRERYGSALLPGVSVAVASIVWASLTWLGWRFDGGWIWWVSLIAGVVAAVAVAFILTPRRKAHDSALFERLSRP